MIQKKRLRVVILGASLDTGNMGVNVLAASTVKCILSCCADAEISFFDYAKTASVQIVRMAHGEVPIPKVHIRFSKKLFLSNNIALLILLALLAKYTLSNSLRKWLLKRNL